MTYPIPDPRNPHQAIQNPLPYEPTPYDERKNRTISLQPPTKRTLAELVGFDQAGLDLLCDQKRSAPNHRRHRRPNKAARVARRRNRT